MIGIPQTIIKVAPDAIRLTQPKTCRQVTT